ncbi:MAG: SH3 domain-containing protein [Candidatus Magasanikbacteria bacterium]|nr:SH3 domain-containing protein [Candidatus Magasanikbacteria bacterium]
MAKDTIGLDISDNTIEVVQLAKAGFGKFRLKAINKVSLPKGVVENSQIKDEEALKRYIVKLFQQAKPKAIFFGSFIFGLQEDQVYTHVFTLGEHEKRERDLLVLEEIKMNIPLEEGNILYSYKILEKNKKGLRILALAANKDMVSEWRTFFKKMKVNITEFDPLALAIYRPLMNEKSKDTICLVDIGSKKTGVTFFDSSGLQYSFVFNIAGDELTKRVVDTKGVDFKKAEKDKLKFGLYPKDKELFVALAGGLDEIAKELDKVIKFYNKKTQKNVEEVVLIGGSSNLKKIDFYLEKKLGFKITIGKVQVLDKNIPLDFTGAVGLAMRGLDSKWSKSDPIIKYKNGTTGKIKKFFSFGKEKEVKKEVLLKGETLDKINEVDQEDITEMSEDFSFSRAADSKKRRFKKQIFLLIILSIFGILAVGGAYWFRVYEKKTGEQELVSSMIQYTETQSFDLKIPVAVSNDEYSEDRLEGRILKDTINSSGTYNEALAESRINVGNRLKEGEVLWRTPLDRPENPGGVIFPVDFRWLSYREEKLENLYLAELEKLNTDKIPYILNHIDGYEVAKTENENIYYLKAIVTVALNDYIEYDESDLGDGEFSTSVTSTATSSEFGDVFSTSSPTSSIQSGGDTATFTPEGPIIIIADTEVGYLNVRRGPGLNYDILTRVSPGETYILVQESGNWSKLYLGEDGEGWVLSTYTQRQ